MTTRTVRLDADVVQEVEKICAPTKASIGLHISKIVRTKLQRDKARNSEKVGGKKK